MSDFVVTSVEMPPLEQKLLHLKDERDAVASQRTKEDVRKAVEDWVAVRRAHYKGAARFVLGASSFEQDAAVFFEDVLADDGLSDRIFGRLEGQGFGDLSDRTKKQRLGKLDGEIAALEKEMLRHRKAAALAALEAEFGDAA